MKFDNVPVDQDTEILFQREIKLGEYDVLYQKWFWDGITAESIIFLSNDISRLSDNEIEKKVRSSHFVKKDSSMTLKRTESGFTFVNFNFESE